MELDRSLRRDLKRAEDPKKFLRRQRTKMILARIGKASGRGALKGTKATLKFIGSLDLDDKPRRRPVKRKRKIKRRKR